jgi:hypothetical protein
LGFFFEKPLKSCQQTLLVFGERFVYDLNNTMSYITMSYSQTPFPYMWIFLRHNRFEIQKLVIIIGLIIYLNPHIGILIRCEPEMKKKNLFCLLLLNSTTYFELFHKKKKFKIFPVSITVHPTPTNSYLYVLYVCVPHIFLLLLNLML